MNGGFIGYVDFVGELEQFFAFKNWDNQNMWASLINILIMGRKVKFVIFFVVFSLFFVLKIWESDSQVLFKQEFGVQVLLFLL